MIAAKLRPLYVTLASVLVAFPVIEAGAAKLHPGMFGVIGPTVTIDNGVISDNRVEVALGAGGEADTISIDPIGQELLTNLLFELNHYVDVGADGGAVQLGATAIAQPPTITGPNEVTSAGSFTGANGTIDWTAVSTLAPGSNVYVTTLTFSSSAPFGTVRVIQYLDTDAPELETDHLVQLGTFGQADFQLLTVSSISPLGLAHRAPLTAGATCVGWAASAFPALLEAIEGGGTTYAPAGNVIGLTPTTDQRFPGQPTWGPDDMTSAVACDLAAGATSATIVLSVLVSQTAAFVPTLSEWAVLVMVALLAGVAVWRLRTPGVRPAS